MPLLHWDQLTRDELADVTPGAVTVLPIAAIEQHGPHLATATDTALVTTVAERAGAALASGTTMLLAPTQCFGASDHHLPFGATLSLTTATLRSVLLDLLRSCAHAGCRRVLLLNGHGGNAATMAAVVADAARAHELTVAACSYWELIDPPDDLPFPGHAGAFETAMMLAVDPSRVRRDAARPSPRPLPPRHRGMRVETPDLWQRIDGFTDDPRQADAGRGAQLLDACARAVAAAVDELARR